LKEYKEFEKDLDKIIENINLAQFPLQSILLLFHMHISACCLDEKFDLNNNEGSCNCDTIPSVFSYLLNFLNKCDIKTTGSVIELFENLSDELKNDFINIINYGAFCEIAPYIWRNIYDIKISDNLLKLQFKENYFESEKKDIILSSLSTGFSIGNDRKDKEAYFIQVTEYLLKGKFNFDLMKYEIETSKQWYKKHWYNNNLIPDEIYEQLGFTRKEYFEYQTFWLAFADYYIKSSNAIVKYIRENNDDSILISNEYIEHISPRIKKEIFYDLFDEQLIGLNKNTFFKIMKIFSLDIKNNLTNQEGYFPLFFEFQDSYMFSPFNIRTRLSPRNLLFILLKTNKKLFDDSLSHFLEPNLISHAVSLFQNISSIKIEINKKWEKGEFDIVIYEAKKNIILHIQAKGTIPAEGARMTERLESRMNEGINQLDKFKKLSDKDEILSRVFDTKIINPIIIDVLLGSAGFGTEKIWSQINSKKIVALNLSLLHVYIEKYKHDNLELKNFFDDMNKITNEIIKATNPYLEDKIYKIGNKTIIYPSFKYESSKLIKYKYVN
jgi:hypothetical protein